MHKKQHSGFRPVVPLLLAIASLAACADATAPVPSLAPGQDARAPSLASQMNESHRTVPFHHRETFQPVGGWLTPSGPFIDCGVYGILPAAFVGTGVMSHLGRVTTHATFDACTGTAAEGLVVTGSGTFHAANGDAVHVTFTMTWLVFGLDYAHFVLDPMVITGGTGRFAGVTGSGRGEGEDRLLSQWGAWGSSGTMTPPGVSKR